MVVFLYYTSLFHKNYHSLTNFCATLGFLQNQMALLKDILMKTFILAI